MRYFATLLLLSLATLSGCDGGTAPVPLGVPGTYTLLSVNGSPVPAALGPVTSQQLTAIRGDLILRDDGEYLQVIQTRYLDDSGATRTGTNNARGEFVVDGTRIELQERLGPEMIGSIEGSRVRFSLSVGGTNVELRWEK